MLRMMSVSSFFVRVVKHVVKRKEVLSFVFIVEDIFTKRYLEMNKIKSATIFFKDKARVWCNTLKMDRESFGLGPINVWLEFKESYLQNFFPNNFNSTMHQAIYRLLKTS